MLVFQADLDKYDIETVNQIFNNIQKSTQIKEDMILVPKGIKVYKIETNNNDNKYRLRL